MFKLEMDPTFWVTAPITVPGQAAPVEIDVECKWFSKEALAEFEQTVATRTDLDNLCEFVVGWRRIDVPFSRANVERLLSKAPRAGLDIHDAFLAQYFEARRKNS